jgi:predicted nucleotidyltransferase
MKYQDPKTAEQLMVDNLIVKHRAGSHAYGTNIETSDEDYRGIFCADPVNLLTPFFPVREADDQSEEDTKLYELAHFMKLCLDCNPNINETLWVDPSDIVATTPAYEHLRANREYLLSSKVAFTFSGYAVSQLKRIVQSKKKVNYLPDLTKLCEVLQQAIRDGAITEDWIRYQCGDKVYEFMREKEYL